MEKHVIYTSWWYCFPSRVGFRFYHDAIVAADAMMLIVTSSAAIVKGASSPSVSPA
jgi:hypothetical protein